MAVLLAEQGEDYPLRKLFKEKTGFDVLDFMDLSLAMFTVVLDGKRQLRDDYFDPLLSSYEKQTISSYLSAIARTFDENARSQDAGRQKGRGAGLGSIGVPARAAPRPG